MEKKWNLAVRWPTYFISQRQFFPWYIFFFFFRPRKKRVPRIPPVPCIFPMAPTIVLLAFLKDQPRSHEMLAAFIFIPLSRPVPTENKIKRFSVIPSWPFFFLFRWGFSGSSSSSADCGGAREKWTRFPLGSARRQQRKKNKNKTTRLDERKNGFVRIPAGTICALCFSCLNCFLLFSSSSFRSRTIREVKKHFAENSGTMRWRRETIGKTTNRLHNSKDLDFRKVERINVPRYVYFLTSFVSGVGGKKDDRDTHL